MFMMADVLKSNTKAQYRCFLN